MKKEQNIVPVGNQSLTPLITVEAAFNKGRYLFSCGQSVTVKHLLEELPKIIGPSSSGYKLIGRGSLLSNDKKFSDLVKKQQLYKVRVMFDRKTRFTMFDLQKYFWQLLFLAAVAQGIIAWILGSKLSHKLVKMQTSISPDDFRHQIKLWSKDDVDKFQKHFVVDLILYPVLYTLFCISWLATEFRKRGFVGNSYFFVFSNVFIIGGLCDIIENIIHFSNLPDFEKTPDTSIKIASLAALVKWAIMITGILSLVGASLIRIWIMPKPKKAYSNYIWFKRQTYNLSPSFLPVFSS